jgi:hypothetical protein
VKKTLQQKMGVGQPKTLAEASAVAISKLALVAVIGLGFPLLFFWAFTHDQTNVEAQAKWSEQAKEFEERLEFEKKNPEAQVFEF